MNNRVFLLLTLAIFSFPFISASQNIERISFDKSDSTEGYYLSILPQSKQIKGVFVFLTSFTSPENLLSETKLHNVAYANDLLAVFAPMKQKLYADSFAVHRINAILNDIAKRYKADTSKFALGGYDEAGGIALRYTEMSYQRPDNFPVQPKAVFCVDSPVSLFGLWHWAEGQIRKNYWPGAVGDAHYYLDNMTKENGTIYSNRARYTELSPFDSQAESSGNEQYLKNVAVRLYYDTDIEWQLKNRRNSFYDTKMPDASELIKRLLILGNDRAEFVVSKQPGVRSNGVRHPNALSIVDEVNCIVWLKNSLDIFDANAWIPPYKLSIPKNWSTERFSLPAAFAPHMSFKGIEDLRFTPGWGDSSSAEYWSYAYLWWLGETTKIDEASMQANLHAYYAGLIEQNISARQIPSNKQVPTSVTIKKIKTGSADMQTFQGNIHMLDYMTLKPIILNAVIHVKDCPEDNHTVVFVEISPKPVGHPVWQEFEQLYKEFNCKK